MEIAMKCHKCQKSWSYKPRNAQPPVFCTCPSCFSKCRVRSTPDPGPVKVPAGVKALGKKALGKLRDGQLIVGSQSQEQSSGRQIQTQTLIVPSAKRGHTVRPLVAREVVGNCRYCGKPLRERPQLNVMLDEHDRYHSTCILSKIIMESDGDIQAAAKQYGVPLSELKNRVLRLRALGWKLPNGV